MALNFLNRCIWRATSNGTGSFVVDSAVTGYLVPNDCANPDVVDGGSYLYFAESDDKTEWEIAFDTFDAGTNTLPRTNILDSSNGGSVVNFTAAPKVYMGVPLANAVHLGVDALGDTLPFPAVVQGGNASPSATGSNVEGAAVYITGGIGQRTLEVVDYTLLAGKVVTVEINGSDVGYTEGVDWDAETSNDVTAANIAAAIGSIASTDGAVILFTPASDARVFLVYTDDDGTGIKSANESFANGGAITIRTNDGGDGVDGEPGNGGALLIESGNGGDVKGVADNFGGTGGSLFLNSGDGGDSSDTNGGTGGFLQFSAGNGGEGAEDGGDGGSFSFGAGLGNDGAAGDGGNGGSFTLSAGSGGSGATSGGDGGDITIAPGAAGGGGSNRQGYLILLNVPAGDPTFSGAVYVDGSGFLKLSP